MCSKTFKEFCSAPWGADRRIMPYNISRWRALSSFQEIMLILEHLWYIFGQDFPAQVIHSCPKSTQESICLWDYNSGIFMQPTIVKRLLPWSNFNSSWNVSTNEQKLNRWCYRNHSRIFPISLFLKSHIPHFSTLNEEDTKLKLRAKGQKNSLATLKTLRWIVKIKLSSP